MESKQNTKISNENLSQQYWISDPGGALTARHVPISTAAFR
jgi:hypothetical protein